MDRADPAHVGKVDLREGCAQRARVGLPNQFEPAVQFAIDVRDPARRIELFEHLDPLAVDRRVEQRRKPQRTRHPRPFFQRFAQLLMRRHPVDDRPGRDDIMIEPLEREAVQVHEVSGHVQAHDEALVSALDRPEHVAGNQNRAGIGDCAAREQDFARLRLTPLDDQRFNILEVVMTELVS